MPDKKDNDNTSDEVQQPKPSAGEDSKNTDAGAGGQLTLHEIIARQRAQLKAQADEHRAQSSREAPAAAGSESTPVAGQSDEPKSDSSASAKASEQQAPDAAPPGLAAGAGNVSVGVGEAKMSSSRPGGRESCATEMPKVAKSFGAVMTAGRKSRLMPILLAANTVLIIVVVVVVLRMGSSPASSDASMRQAAMMRTELAPVGGVEASEELNVPIVMNDGTRREAEAAFGEGRHREALNKYEILLSESKTAPTGTRLRDYLNLRIAECLVKLGQANKARDALRDPSRSASPVVRSLANRDLAVLDCRQGQYLAARRRAYVAMGALGFAESGYGIETDCDYLIARALTEEMLALGGEKLDVPWDDVRSSDPFTGKTLLLIRRALADGVSALAKADREPSIRRIDDAPMGSQWEVVFSDVLLEDILGRVSVESGLGIKWVSIEPQVRRRVVPVLGGRGVSLHKLMEIACGSAGLLARFTGEEVHVHDPRWSDSLAVRKDLMVREAVSVWRRFFLRAPKDPRVATGHYTLGRLHEIADQPLEAMRVYRLVSRRYWRSKVGPRSLLGSATIRIEQLRDYVGAERELMELLDRYPETELFGDVYVKLGHARVQAGMLDKAARTFEWLYHFDEVSTEHRRLACLEAGKCFYQSKRYDESAKWITRYLGLSEGSSDQTCEAYILLGQSAAAAGNHDEAALAYQRVLGGNPTNSQRTEAMLALVRVQMQRQKYVHVVGALQQLEREKLTRDQYGRFLLIACEAYRGMSLPRKAVTLLSNHAASIEDLAVRTKLQMELARCQRQLGRHAQARAALAEVLSASGHSEIGYEAQCELAEVSLDMDEIAEAITTAETLVESECSQKIRVRASEVLGRAYVRSGQYDKAAQALASVAKSQSRGKDNE